MNRYLKFKDKLLFKSATVLMAVVIFISTAVSNYNLLASQINAKQEYSKSTRNYIFENSLRESGKTPLLPCSFFYDVSENLEFDEDEFLFVLNSAWLQFVNVVDSIFSIVKLYHFKFATFHQSIFILFKVLRL